MFCQHFKIKKPALTGRLSNTKLILRLRARRTAAVGVTGTDTEIRIAGAGVFQYGIAYAAIYGDIYLIIFPTDTAYHNIAAVAANGKAAFQINRIGTHLVSACRAAGINIQLRPRGVKRSALAIAFIISPGQGLGNLVPHI